MPHAIPPPTTNEKMYRTSEGVGFLIDKEKCISCATISLIVTLIFNFKKYGTKLSEHRG